MKTNSKGFTLIELLVVIAIIGILSTIAMTSLNGARKKAKDSSFQSSAASVQAAAIICCDTTGMKLADADTTIAPGAGICYNSTNVAQTSYGTYPAATAVATITITRDCSNAAGWAITMTPPTGGTLTSGICSETGCTFS